MLATRHPGQLVIATIVVTITMVALVAGCEGSRVDLLTIGDQPATSRDVPAYDRDQFGGWADLDRDGCDAREEALEAVSPVPSDFDGDGCADDGAVRDGYTGDLLHPSDADVDHVVPLVLIWSGGAWSWTDQQRREVANWSGNLIVTAGGVNRTKGSLGPDEWEPLNPGAYCDYAEAWWATVAEWGLTWGAERDTSYDTALTGLCPVGR